MLNPDVALVLARLLAAPLIVGAGIVALGWAGQSATTETPPTATNPLRLMAAIRMALAFQVALTAIAAVRSAWGVSGLYASGAVLGLTDVDALTVSMSQVDAGIAAEAAARAIAIGILANTVLKLAVSAVFGSASFRRTTVPGLFALGAASGVGLWLL